MRRDPIFVTDMMIAKSSGFVIATFNAPAGEFGEGKIETLEIVRVVMSHSTLVAVSALLQRTCQEIGLSAIPNDSANDRPRELADPDRGAGDAEADRRPEKPLRH